MACKIPEVFDREESGLVDLNSYLPYLPDPTDQVPLRAAKKNGTNPDSSRFINQHVYFTEPLYRQVEKSSGEIDLRFRRLRTLSWSQIVMRRSEEVRLHLEKEPFVEPPLEQTVDGTLRDYFDIDIVGAATLGIREAKRQKKHDPLAELFYTPPEVKKLSKADRIDIFEEERKRALSDLDSPRVVPHKLIHSAIKRLSVYLKDPTLDRMANEKLAGERYFPLRVPKYGTFRSIGNAILLDSVGIKSLEDSRLLVQGLQTGVDQVKLAAA